MKHKPIFDTVQEENEHDYKEIMRSPDMSMKSKLDSKMYKSPDLLESSFYRTKRVNGTDPEQIKNNLPLLNLKASDMQNSESHF